MKTKLSCFEVAKRLGVSHMTVSRAFDENSPISEKTRAKVLAACRKYGYQPSPLGRALRRGSLNSICVIVPVIYHDAYSRLIDGIQESALRFGYNITIYKPQQTGVITLPEIEFLLSHRFKGIIIDCECDDACVNALRDSNTPVINVIVKLRASKNDFYFIGTDDVDGARKATEHLIQLGRTRLIHLAPPKEFSHLRPKGFMEKVEEYSLRESLIVDTGWRFEDGYEKTLRLIDDNVAFNGIVAANDYVAAGALHALHEQGINVPDDVSIVGFAGDKIGEIVFPPLTTVFQPFEKVGERAVEVLMRMIDHNEIAIKDELLENTLIVRKSTARRVG